MNTKKFRLVAGRQPCQRRDCDRAPREVGRLPPERAEAGLYRPGVPCILTDAGCAILLIYVRGLATGPSGNRVRPYTSFNTWAKPV